MGFGFCSSIVLLPGSYLHSEKGSLLTLHGTGAASPQAALRDGALSADAAHGGLTEERRGGGHLQHTFQESLFSIS